MGVGTDHVPGQTHVLRSTTVLTSVEYGPDRVKYSAFEPRGEEILRIARAPASITVGGKAVAEATTRNFFQLFRAARSPQDA